VRELSFSFTAYSLFLRCFYDDPEASQKRSYDRGELSPWRAGQRVPKKFPFVLSEKERPWPLRS
jgi:hypothetical protein